MQKNIQTILQNTFGLESFRDRQEEIIENIIAWNDTLVFMPTGWGKSLTYQLPGLVREWITVVISPLISLMKDQVDALRKLWVRAELINSTLSGKEKDDIMYELKYSSQPRYAWDEYSEASSDNNPIKFLYIAPERLNSREFISILKQTKISLIAIDEAHCISQWWHDFRPSYMKIKSFIEELAGEQREFPIVGLTATATQKVRTDIVERLWLTKFTNYISGFDRKNIILVVREISVKEEKQKKIVEIIEKTPWVWIIYCSSRKHVIEVSEYLVSVWIKAWIYKGDLSAGAREDEQNKFMNDEYKVMVATNAFGMWIDKKDIRFVIHYNLPGSIENYYQEVWRAGRDGRMSYGIVLASYGDTKIQEFFIDHTYPEKKQILEFYDYLYKDFKTSEGKWTRVAKTYFVLASESGVGNDMIVWSIIKILEKYNIIRRWLEETDSESDFRGRGLTLLQDKRPHSHLMIDWKRQDLLKDESNFKLEQMKRLLFYPSCRKRFILEYFGDTEDLATLWDNCWLCDFCLEWNKFSAEEKEKIVPASTYGLILETVKKYNEKFGQTLLSKVLHWSSEKRIQDWNLDVYEHFGALKEFSLTWIQALFEALQMEWFLFKTDGKYPLIWVTELGWAAVYKDKYIQNVLSDLNTYVLQKVWKKLSNSSTTPAKKWTSSLKQRLSQWSTYSETHKLFQQKKSIQEISIERELSVQTVESHIITLYTQWEVSLADAMKLVDYDKTKIVKKAIDSDALFENTQLKPIKDALEAEWKTDISYFDIKLTIAMMEKGDV